MRALSISTWCNGLEKVCSSWHSKEESGITLVGISSGMGLFGMANVEYSASTLPSLFFKSEHSS